MPFFIAFLLIGVTLFGFRFWTKRLARNRLLSAPLTDYQRAVIMRAVPLFRKVPPKLQKTIEGKINLFLYQIEFIGCNGLDVTEEMELAIAAQACLLVANKTLWYTSLRTILIYPDAFTSRKMEQDGYIVTERETTRIGESWARGPVVLSWLHSEQGAFIGDDGHNVVLHEFAHQLDGLSGHTDGAPVLGAQFKDWQTVLNEAYERLVSNVKLGNVTFLDAYGATAPEEFFAVLVEVFFEKPIDLKTEEPAVYAQLSEFFELDPAAWHAGHAVG